MTYRDSLDATPGWARSLPIYITETTPDVGWEDVNSGWIKNAYQQVDSWNARVGTQKIRALVLFIWSTDNLRFQIKHRPQAIQDFKEAMANPYRWTSSACPDLAGG